MDGVMRTIKKNELVNKLKENNISEGLIEKILARISKVNNKSELDKVEKSIKNNNVRLSAIKDELRQKFIDVYGSLSNTPQSQLDLLDR
jgi:SOS response regulatory protein OraA/RecX